MNMHQLYKARYKENYTGLDNQPEFVDEIQGNRRTLFARYDNAIELSEKATQEGRKINSITGFYELIQIKIGFEYDVCFELIKIEHLEEMKWIREWEQQKREKYMKSSLSIHTNPLGK